MSNTRAESVSSLHEPAVVRNIAPADLAEVLRKGWDDFLEKPSHVVFIVLIYPLVGLALARLTFGYDVLPLLYPLMAGFALVGPFASVGLYELSRRREQGLSTRWTNVFKTLRHTSKRPVLALGGVLVVLFLAWMATAQVIYWMTFGDVAPASLQAFIEDVLTTDHGLTLLIIGNLAGAVFAIIVLMISVASFPMLLDREVSALAAVRTSIAACLANPFTMALWGVIVAVSLAIGSLPFFAGLAIVLPVLGHATWHLYRRLVVA